MRIRPLGFYLLKFLQRNFRLFVFQVEIIFILLNKLKNSTFLSLMFFIHKLRKVNCLVIIKPFLYFILNLIFPCIVFYNSFNGRFEFLYRLIQVRCIELLLVLNQANLEKFILSFKFLNFLIFVKSEKFKHKLEFLFPSKIDRFEILSFLYVFIFRRKIQPRYEHF